MKTNTRLLILATSALLLTACSEDNNTLGGPVKARITAGVSGPKVKAIDNRWNADKIGVMVTATTGTSTTMINKYKNVAYETSSTTMSADFDPVSQSDGIFFEDANAEFTFAAYAPYASSYGRSTLPGDNGKVPVNTEDQPNVAKQERIDYIYATGAKAGKNNPVISFINNTSMGGTDCSFKHKMARLILKVQVSEADGFTKPSVLRLANYKLGGLIHEGTFDILTGTATATGPVVNDWLLDRKSVV